MNNSEINIKQILNHIDIGAHKNPLLAFFELLQTSSILPLHSRLFLGLQYYYDSGYKHFRTIEWGFNDVNQLNYKDRVVTKPYGNLIRAIYNLCKEAHTLQNIAKVRVPYSNAYDWFISCLLELPAYDLEYLVFKNNANFVEMWKERVETLQSLAYPPDYIDEDSQKFAPYRPEYNPFLSSGFCRFSSGLLLLVECAYSLAATIPDFEKKYWRPFIQAQKDIASTLEKSTYLMDARITKTEDGTFIQFKENTKGKKFGKPKKIQ